MYTWTICTHIHRKARKKGPEVNIRGRHLQVHLSSHFSHLKKRCCLFFYSLNTSLKHLHTIFHQLVKKREFNVCTTCCAYIPTNPPSPWPVFGMFHQLPQGSCVHSHTQKYTIFNIFTVAYYSQTSLHQSNSRMINIRQQLSVFNRSFVEKSKKGHKSTVNK